MLEGVREPLERDLIALGVPPAMVALVLEVLVGDARLCQVVAEHLREIASSPSSLLNAVGRRTSSLYKRAFSDERS